MNNKNRPEGLFGKIKFFKETFGTFFLEPEDK
jgi:hypothetical protein